MIAYLEPAQYLGTLVMGVGLGIMLTRAYDAVRHALAMRRIGRNVKAYAARWEAHRKLVALLQPPYPKTSGPETAPANRDPQEPTADHLSVSVTPGVAVQSADAGEGVAPPARSFNLTKPWNGPWDVDHGDDWDEYDFTAADRRKP